MAQPLGRRNTRTIIWALADALERVHGLRNLYTGADDRVGLVSACTDVTVWYLAVLGSLRWREDGAQVTWPATDIYGAAARIAARCHGLAGRPGSGGEGGPV